MPLRNRDTGVPCDTSQCKHFTPRCLFRSSKSRMTQSVWRERRYLGVCQSLLMLLSRQSVRSQSAFFGTHSEILFPLLENLAPHGEPSAGNCRSHRQQTACCFEFALHDLNHACLSSITALEHMLPLKCEYPSAQSAPVPQPSAKNELHMRRLLGYTLSLESCLRNRNHCVQVERLCYEKTAFQILPCLSQPNPAMLR